jgi:hypothetical protein
MSGQQRIKKSPAQLVQDHWKFILRITNDKDEAQELALHVLDTFEQFKAERAAFAAFIKMKLMELRWHYSDNGLVEPADRRTLRRQFNKFWKQAYPGKKAQNEDFEAYLTAIRHRYPSLDEVRAEGEGDDEDVEVSLYNLIAAPPPPDIHPDLREVYYEETKPRHESCAKANANLGRCPEPRKLRPRLKRVSEATLRRERVAEAIYAPRIKSRIYLADRAAGNALLPKDTLWQADGPVRDLTTFDDRAFRRSRCGNQWSAWQNIHNYRGLLHITRRREGRPSFLTRVRQMLSASMAIRKENNDLLWAALRVLCYKRRWPRGIPKAKAELYPDDEFSPRQRLVFQARHVLLAAKKPAH